MSDASSLSLTVNGRAQVFAHTRSVTVGRGLGSDFRIPSDRVSRLHATIKYDQRLGAWVVTDAGSANGVYLDGHRVNSAALSDGQWIRLGNRESDPQIFVSVVASQPRVVTARAAKPNLNVRSEIVIGKAPDVDFIVSDVLVSRRHARLVDSASGLLVEDLASTNGTYVNGALVSAWYVREGDVITVGNTDLTIRNGVLAYLHEDPVVTGGLSVVNLDYALSSGKKLLSGVNLRVRPGTLTAVIGPSGAGKSTLAKVLAGVNAPTKGSVEFDGFNVHKSFELIRSRIGLVPQDDVLHTSLRVDRALGYAARLRLRSDEDGQTRRTQVDRVIAQLELENHRSTRIDKLSGGQRKRASVALELLTEPSMLILDEPTSGLDPALDRQVMQTLRGLAADDRSVLVITHSVAYLDLCDEVLILAPGGMPAYYGPPQGIAAFFGTEDWADIFGSLAAEPEHAAQVYRERTAPVVPEVLSSESRLGATRAARIGWVSQFLTLMTRQFNLIFADRVYLGFLLVLPFIVGLLVLVVPGSRGLGYADNASPGEPSQLLAMLIIGSTFMGASISIRDLVGERPVFLRERAVGLPVSAYLASKVVVFGLFAIFMAAVLTAVTFIAKPIPLHSLIFASPVAELFIALALTTIASMTLGLALSSFVRSSEQVMPLLIIVLMAQLVLNGGLLALADRPFFYALSNGVLAKWGFAMAASGIDLNGISPSLDEDPLWAHETRMWVLALVWLLSFAVVFTTVTRVRLESRYSR